MRFVLERETAFGQLINGERDSRVLEAELRADVRPADPVWPNAPMAEAFQPLVLMLALTPLAPTRATCPNSVPNRSRSTTPSSVRRPAQMAMVTLPSSARYLVRIAM